MPLPQYRRKTHHLVLKGLVNLQKTFLKLILIEKPVMRETECRKPHQKILNSYQVMKVSKFNSMKICERLKWRHLSFFKY